MSNIIRLSNKQIPCSVCGKDAFVERGNQGPSAFKCPRCNVIFCYSCAFVSGDGEIRVIGCPKCHVGCLSINLDPSLKQNSVMIMPPQSLEGWPELNEVIYQKLIAEVQHYLPVLKAALKDIVPEKDMPAVVERLCFALATGKYMEWCYNRQDEVRAYTNTTQAVDFDAPRLVEMVRLIRELIDDQEH